jgi:phosphate transport system permease protein
MWLWSNPLYPLVASASPLRWLRPLLWLVPVTVMGFLGFMILFLLWHAWPAITGIGAAPFFVSDSWLPVEGDFGLFGALVGSLLLAAVSCLWAVPMSLFTAVFIHFYAPKRLAKILTPALELMAGIPSVVYGIFGLTVLVPIIARLVPPGPSIFVGVLVLGLMILPTVALLVLQGFRSLPADLLSGVKALDIRVSQAIMHVYAPIIRPTVAVASILALTRALGETMVVLMVCGNIPGMPDSIFAPVRTLTANIALEMAYALELHQAALFFSGVLLLAITVIMVLIASGLRTEELPYGNN